MKRGCIHYEMSSSELYFETYTFTKFETYAFTKFEIWETTERVTFLIFVPIYALYFSFFCFTFNSEMKMYFFGNFHLSFAIFIMEKCFYGLKIYLRC